LALEIAFSQITGNLKESISGIRKSLSDIQTRIQAEIDFPDEIPDSIIIDPLISEIQQHIIFPIQKLIQNHDQFSFLKEGIQAIIIGAPNVGKSSLMNYLSRKDKSIVTAYPGTTRDLIEEHINFYGFPMLLTDTAGLHSSTDPIETLGMERALSKIKQADLILFMLQAGHPLTQNELQISELLLEKHVILVFNKVDLLTKHPEIELPVTLSRFPSVYISVLKNTGLDSLEVIIENKISQSIEGFNDFLMPNIRQKNLLDKTLASLYRLIEGVCSKVPSDLWVLDLRDAIMHLDQISGENLYPDVLDQIFNNFCIGK
jgi:tRNA modification GTPase